MSTSCCKCCSWVPRDHTASSWMHTYIAVVHHYKTAKKFVALWNNFEVFLNNAAIFVHTCHQNCTINLYVLSRLFRHSFAWSSICCTFILWCNFIVAEHDSSWMCKGCGMSIVGLIVLVDVHEGWVMRWLSQCIVAKMIPKSEKNF